MLLGVGVCQATPITYTVDYTLNSPFYGVGTIKGTITTDGATGTVNAGLYAGPGTPNPDTGDIISWDLTLTGSYGGGASFTLTNLNSNTFGRGSDLTATPTDLYFNFGGGDGGFLLFQVVFSSGQYYTCDAATGVGNPCFQGATITPTGINGPGFDNVPLTDNEIIGFVGATPLPSTWTMLIAGLIGLGFFTYRTKKTAAILAVA